MRKSFSHDADCRRAYVAPQRWQRQHDADLQDMKRARRMFYRRTITHAAGLYTHCYSAAKLHWINFLKLGRARLELGIGYRLIGGTGHGSGLLSCNMQLAEKEPRNRLPTMYIHTHHLWRTRGLCGSANRCTKTFSPMAIKIRDSSSNNSIAAWR